MTGRDSNQKDGVGRDSYRYVLNMPDGVRWRVKESAAKNRRSMNAEILTLIERGLHHADPKIPDS